MDSVPPAMTMRAVPEMMVEAASERAFMLLAQTLLTVVAVVLSGREAPMAHWRAGF